MPRRAVPLHPFLFASYLVLFLYAQNLGEVDGAEVLPVLGLALAGTAVALAVTSLALRDLRDLRRGAIVASALVVAFLGYGHVANALPNGVPGWLQQLAWVGFIVVAVLVARRMRDRLPGATRALNAIAAILVIVTLVTIVPHQFGRATTVAAGPSPLPLRPGAVPLEPKRDIWYLIFDRYASNDQLKAAYGIDGRLAGWLRDRGFFVAEGSRANYVKTSLSLASSLNLTYLDDVAARMGPDSPDHAPIFAMMQDHVLGRFLKSQGYRFVQVGSPYGPTAVNPYADVNPRRGSTSDFAAAIYDESVLPAVARRLGLTHSTPLRERYYKTGLFQWDELLGLVDDPGPKLVFSHFLLPHPPYVFNRDGSFAAEDDPGGVAGNYARQLDYTDSRIEELVTKLQALPADRRPIIVLQADEGPYPPRYSRNTITFDWSTATPEELRMKFGILNAYDLPGIDPAAEGVATSISPVNSFRYILGRYFGTDTPLLPDRSYTSAGKLRPYDLTEVTDRLAAP